MAATMKDVAEHANLSLGTVSNYINGKVKVSQEKQMRIEAAISALEYTVNLAARNLRTHSFQSIGVLIPTFRNVYLLRVISVMEELLREHGYKIVVVSYQATTELEQLRDLVQRVDGIVYVPRTLDDAGCAQIASLMVNTPMVIFDESIDGLQCDRVLVDSRKVVQSAITTLLQKGHVNVGMLAGPACAYTSQQRLSGYRDAFQAYGYPVNEDIISYCDYSKRSGEEVCLALLQKDTRMTALLTVGYRMTLGAMRTLRERGVQDDVALIGYDMVDMEGIVAPEVAYVYQPYDEIAKQVVSLILRRVNKDMEGFPATISLEADMKNVDALLAISAT